MPAPAQARPAQAARPPAASGHAIPNINPVTGLSTDYLNHFSEALMALEMVRDMPECVEDLRAWVPKTYAEHFAQSRLGNRDTIIRTYQDAPLRAALDALAQTLNTRLVEARDRAVSQVRAGAAGFAPEDAASAIRPLVLQLAALIAGAAGGPAERERSQAAIDAMFAG